MAPVRSSIGVAAIQPPATEAVRHTDAELDAVVLAEHGGPQIVNLVTSVRAAKPHTSWALVEHGRHLPSRRLQSANILAARFEQQGLRNEWLIAAICLHDRLLMATTSTSKLWRFDMAALFAMSLSAMKLGGAEIQLDRGLQDVVFAIAKKNRKDQNFWKEVLQAELSALRCLEYSLATPTPWDFCQRLVPDIVAEVSKLCPSWSGLEVYGQPTPAAISKGFSADRTALINSEKLPVPIINVGPRFGMLALFLVELGLVHLPKESYRVEPMPLGLALAALRISLESLDCPSEILLDSTNTLQRTEDILSSDSKRSLKLLISALRVQWSRPGQGNSVASRWRLRCQRFGWDFPGGPTKKKLHHEVKPGRPAETAHLEAKPTRLAETTPVTKNKKNPADLDAETPEEAMKLPNNPGLLPRCLALDQDSGKGKGDVSTIRSEDLSNTSIESQSLKSCNAQLDRLSVNTIVETCMSDSLKTDSDTIPSQTSTRKSVNAVGSPIEDTANNQSEDSSGSEEKDLISNPNGKLTGRQDGDVSSSQAEEPVTKPSEEAASSQSEDTFASQTEDTNTSQTVQSAISRPEDVTTSQDQEDASAQMEDSSSSQDDHEVRSKSVAMDVILSETATTSNFEVAASSGSEDMSTSQSDVVNTSQSEEVTTGEFQDSSESPCTSTSTCQPSESTSQSEIAVPLHGKEVSVNQSDGLVAADVCEPLGVSSDQFLTGAGRCIQAVPSRDVEQSLQCQDAQPSKKESHQPTAIGQTCALVDGQTPGKTIAHTNAKAVVSPQQAEAMIIIDDEADEEEEAEELRRAAEYEKMAKEARERARAAKVRKRQRPQSLNNLCQAELQRAHSAIARGPGSATQPFGCPDRTADLRPHIQQFSPSDSLHVALNPNFAPVIDPSARMLSLTNRGTPLMSGHNPFSPVACSPVVQELLVQPPPLPPPSKRRARRDSTVAAAEVQAEFNEPIASRLRPRVSPTLPVLSQSDVSSTCSNSSGSRRRLERDFSSASSSSLPSRIRQVCSDCVTGTSASSMASVRAGSTSIAKPGLYQSVPVISDRIACAPSLPIPAGGASVPMGISSTAMSMVSGGRCASVPLGISSMSMPMTGNSAYMSSVASMPLSCNSFSAPLFSVGASIPMSSMCTPMPIPVGASVPQLGSGAAIQMTTAPMPVAPPHLPPGTGSVLAAAPTISIKRPADMIANSLNCAQQLKMLFGEQSCFPDLPSKAHAQIPQEQLSKATASTRTKRCLEYDPLDMESNMPGSFSGPVQAAKKPRGNRRSSVCPTLQTRSVHDGYDLRPITTAFRPC